MENETPKEEVVQEQPKKNKFLKGLKYIKSVLMKTTNGMAIGLFGPVIDSF